MSKALERQGKWQGLRWFVTALARLSLVVILASGFSLVPASSTSAHGGGLDSDGGHNCYVNYCAGTYYCHQARGPRCQLLSQPMVTTRAFDGPREQVAVGNEESVTSDEMGLRGWSIVLGFPALLASLAAFWNWAKDATRSKLRGIRQK